MPSMRVPGIGLTVALEIRHGAVSVPLSNLNSQNEPSFVPSTQITAFSRKPGNVVLILLYNNLFIPSGQVAGGVSIIRSPAVM